MITSYGINDRDHIAQFQNVLIQENLNSGATYDPDLSSSKLGKNWGGSLWEKNGRKLLVFIDADDGSGGTSPDCKIIWSTFQTLLLRYKPHDYMILKSQVNSDPSYNQFYPFKMDVVPLGVFSNNPESIQIVKSKLTNVQQDIDVFFSGGLKFKDLRPYAWPKERDPRAWWPGASMRGYKRLTEIKLKRKDINIEVHDAILSPTQFYDKIARSKICIDLPGIGLSSRKFYEYLVLEKCVLSLKQQLTPWSCDENIHYCSMGYDLDFNCMEEKIDELLSSGNWRTIEKNVASIQSQLTMRSMIDRAKRIIETKIDSINDFVLFH